MKLKLSIALGVVLAALLSVPTVATEGDGHAKVHHRHAYRHMREAAKPGAVARNATPRVLPAGAAPIAFPAVAPYPNGQGDEDGLSRHIGDCNKGCIGGNPG
jgi:hypothetical protein